MCVNITKSALTRPSVPLAPKAIHPPLYAEPPSLRLFPRHMEPEVCKMLAAITAVYNKYGKKVTQA